MRFARCSIKGIRRGLGNGFPVIVRVSGEEKSTGGMGIAETRAMCRALEKYGVDAYHYIADEIIASGRADLVSIGRQELSLLQEQ